MKKRSIFVFCVLLLAFCPQPASATPIYSNDFEGSVGAEWSTTDTTTDDTAPDDFSQFLGRFGNRDSVDEWATLTLPTNIGDDYTLEFDLYIIDSWDGDHSTYGGPDYFNVSINASLEFHEMFDNYWGGFYQSFREPDVGRDNMGFNASPHEDAIYRDIQINFTASGLQTEIKFQGVGLDVFPDESWGIDNVSVIPEPATLLLLGLGGLVLRRRRKG